MATINNLIPGQNHEIYDPGPSAPRRTIYIEMRRIIAAYGDLFLVLAFQAYLSFNLVWSNTAFTDEALYLRSGHLEIDHWLHSTPIPAFQTYFSGAPVFYPPIAAVADTAGGLAGARLLSLIFMLATTFLLWATATEICSRRAGFFGATIFAVAGPTLRLGAFATYDAMSLFFIALSAYCAIRAGQSERTSGWLVGAAMAMTAANVAKYASALFDLIPVVLLLLTSLSMIGWRGAIARCGTMVSYAVGTIVFLLTFGGSEYLTGVEQTTLGRSDSIDSGTSVFLVSWQLTAAVIILALVAAVLGLAAERSWPRRILILVLAGSVLLVPLEQARIHTLTSLNKHLAFGAWFAAIAVGYGIDLVISKIGSRAVQVCAVLAGALLLSFPMRVGYAQAKTIFNSWPNSAAAVRALSQILPATSGPILDDNNRAVPEYYLAAQGNQWYRWSNNSSLRLPGGRAISVRVGGTLDPELYVTRIQSGYFSVVILNFGSAASFDHTLLTSLDANPHYHMVASTPYGQHQSQIWEYQPQSRFASEALGPPPSQYPEPLGSILTPTGHLRPILGSIYMAVIESLGAVVIFTGLVRCTWRRGKANNEI